MARKLDLLESSVRGQSVEINQLRAKIQKLEMHLSMANVQIETLLQAQNRTEYFHQNKSPALNVTIIIQQIDERVQRLESKVSFNTWQQLFYIE